MAARVPACLSGGVDRAVLCLCLSQLEVFFFFQLSTSIAKSRQLRAHAQSAAEPPRHMSRRDSFFFNGDFRDEASVVHVSCVPLTLN